MKTIILFAGHGGDDNGASYGFVDEDDTNLSISNYVYLMLKLKGFNVIRGRIKDEKISLSDRVIYANSTDADAFVSIHCDAFHNKTASGMSAHVYDKTTNRVSMGLADSIIQSMSEKFPDHKSRGVKRSNFYVLKKTKMPAILIECEFLSNPLTCDFLKEPENQYSMAEAITSGIYKQFMGV